MFMYGYDTASHIPAAYAFETCDALRAAGNACYEVEQSRHRAHDLAHHRRSVVDEPARPVPLGPAPVGDRRPLKPSAEAARTSTTWANHPVRGRSGPEAIRLVTAGPWAAVARLGPSLAATSHRYCPTRGVVKNAGWLPRNSSALSTAFFVDIRKGGAPRMPGRDTVDPRLVEGWHSSASWASTATRPEGEHHRDGLGVCATCWHLRPLSRAWELTCTFSGRAARI